MTTDNVLYHSYTMPSYNKEGTYNEDGKCGKKDGPKFVTATGVAGSRDKARVRVNVLNRGTVIITCGKCLLCWCDRGLTCGSGSSPSDTNSPPQVQVSGTLQKKLMVRLRT